MPNWNQPFDIYNNNKWDNFNPYDVPYPSERHKIKYFPYDDYCSMCMLDLEVPKRSCYGTSICKQRRKDHSAGKDVVLLRSLGKEKDYDSILIRSGNFNWLYARRVKLWIRPSTENGLALHHKKGNPFDNRASEVAIVDKHEAIHGHLRILQKQIFDLQLLASKTPDPLKKEYQHQILKLQRQYEKEAENISDSSRVFRIIEILTDVLSGNTNVLKAQKQLENLKAAFPLEIKQVKEYNDMRKMKGKHEQILQKINGVIDYDKPVPMFLQLDV